MGGWLVSCVRYCVRLQCVHPWTVFGCVCCGGVSGCVILAVGVGSVEVRQLLKNVLLEKDKERVSISGQFPASETANFLNTLLVPQEMKCSFTTVRRKI